jgi:hypothetical protein
MVTTTLLSILSDMATSTGNDLVRDTHVPQTKDTGPPKVKM